MTDTLIDLAALISAIEAERNTINKVYTPSAPYDWCIGKIKQFAQPINTSETAGWPHTKEFDKCLADGLSSKVYSTNTSDDGNYQGAMADLDDLVRVCIHNRPGLDGYLRDNYPKEWSERTKASVMEGAPAKVVSARPDCTTDAEHLVVAPSTNQTLIQKLEAAQDKAPMRTGLMDSYDNGFHDAFAIVCKHLADQSREISVDAETLSDVVDEYLHWRKVNPHIKGGENYLKRLREATPAREQGEISADEEFEKKLAILVPRVGNYADLRHYAGILSNRLREMDKRAKAANKRADDAEGKLKRESGKVWCDEEVVITKKQIEELNFPAQGEPEQGGDKIAVNQIEGDKP